MPRRSPRSTPNCAEAQRAHRAHTPLHCARRPPRARLLTWRLERAPTLAILRRAARVPVRSVCVYGFCCAAVRETRAASVRIPRPPDISGQGQMSPCRCVKQVNMCCVHEIRARDAQRDIAAACVFLAWSVAGALR